MIDGGSSAAPERCLSISSLSPYVHRWTVKARVVEKSPLQTTKNSSKFFHIDITDSSGHTIRAKFWGDAAEKWFEAVHRGSVYLFSKGRVNVANKRFSTLDNNYEISFNADADIRPSQDDGNIQAQKRSIFNSTRECPFPADLLVVISEVQPISGVTARQSGQELKRRVLKVRDQSQMEMEVSLWGEQVCALTAVNVREWRSARSGSTTKASQLLRPGKNELPPSEEAKAEELLSWYKSVQLELMDLAQRESRQNFYPSLKSNSVLRSWTNPPLLLHFDEVESDVLSQNGFYAFIGQLRRVFWKPRSSSNQTQPQQQDVYAYAACPSCRKKLQEGSTPGDFSCFACGANNVSPDWRYMILAAFTDASGSISCRCFADMGQLLLKRPASEVRKMSGEAKQHFFDWECLMDSHFRVTVRGELDNYGGESRMRFTAIRVDHLDAHTLASLLLQQCRSQGLRKRDTASLRGGLVPQLPDLTNFDEGRKFKNECDPDDADHPKKMKVEGATLLEQTC